MGRPWAKKCVHVNFGRVKGMKTRTGQVVLLTDVLNEAKSLAREKVVENEKAGRIQTDDVEALSEQIGLGAIIFGDLKNRRTSDYEFNWDEVLRFDGHTGPYLQYAHARACNILRKGGGTPPRYDAALLTLPQEQTLVRLIARFPEAVAEAADTNEPSVVSRHLLDLAAAFSELYTLGNQDRDKRVLLETNAPLREARLALTDAIRITLAEGLKLLGVRAPENM
jgi:arginyl-tRNA synthetase